MKCDSNSGRSDAAAARCRRRLPAMLCLCLVLVLCGCAGRTPFVGSRPFHPDTDAFSFANELVWEYHFDENGKWVHERRQPEPDYTHHCFVVARSARQFFQHARFDPSLPPPDEAQCRRLIRRVVDVDPSRSLPEPEKIVIPGYANLREFSAAWEPVLKAECGGAWRSYIQRGHWRIIFPFSRSHQTAAAERFQEDLRQNRPPVVHLVRFPQLTINHAVVVFDAVETDREIVFSVYDPNKPDQSGQLTFDRAARTFSFPANDYFPGGRVDAYEIYRNWKY